MNRGYVKNFTIEMVCDRIRLVGADKAQTDY